MTWPVNSGMIRTGSPSSPRFGETLMLAGMKPSTGSVGDAFDNALAETTIGLCKTEAVREDRGTASIMR